MVSSGDALDHVPWVRQHDIMDSDREKKIRMGISQLRTCPLISIVMKIESESTEQLCSVIDSVRGQLYENWQLCIAVRGAAYSVLERYAEQDHRVRSISFDSHDQSAAMFNAAIAVAEGDFIALIRSDSVLAPDTMFWVAEAIERVPKVGMIYGDEDRVGEDGVRTDPYFKCDWNYDLFLSQNFVESFVVFRADLVRAVGGIREDFGGLSGYDLALRCIENLHAKQIAHIPRILCHRSALTGKMIAPTGIDPQDEVAGARVLNQHFARKGIQAIAEAAGNAYRIRYQLPDPSPLVSLVIPTRNCMELIRCCVTSILERTTYPNYEILIIDNGSDDEEAVVYLDMLRTDQRHRVRILRDDGPFNYSALNNKAIKVANGEIIGLINNDIEVISPGWLEEMVSIAVQPGVGAVGARLWYRNDTLQHGGVILGIYGGIGHAHRWLTRGQAGYHGRAQATQSFSAVTGACLLLRKTLYQQVGGLDEENLAVAYSDVDLCLKLGAAGFRNIWTPFAELYHSESASRGRDDTPQKQARHNRELGFMWSKWADVMRNDPAYNPNLSLSREDFSNDAVSNRADFSLADHMDTIPTPLPRRIKRTAHAVRDLRAILEPVIDRIGVVSFDIFDTLFERDIDPPERVKHIIARHLATHLSELYESLVSPQQILYLRNTVEAELRHGASRIGKDHECSFSDIADGLVRRLLGRDDEALSKHIIETELRVETEVLFVKKGMLELLDWLKAQRKRLIAVSDMYLESDHLRLLLEKKGLAEYFSAIYVSSEQSVNKSSGRLFRHVLEEEAVSPWTVIHIGDNRHADHDIPARFGMHVVHLNDIANHKRRHVLKWYARLADRNPYWRGRYLLQLIRPASSGSDNFSYCYGYQVLGPVYAAFMQGAIEVIKRHRVRRVFFIAREGELFKRIYEHLVPTQFELGQAPVTSYLCLSRFSTALASCCRGMSHQQAILPLYHPDQKGLYSIFRIYDLDAERLMPIASRYGFTNLEAPITNWEDKAFRALLADEDFQAEVKREAALARELLALYLEQHDYFKDRAVAFVDIGWSGTIQKFIEDTFLDRLDAPYIHGLYLGMSRGIHYEFKPLRSHAAGVFCDAWRGNPQESAMLGFMELFEEGARALHATTVGYRQDPESGRVEPIFKDESSLSRRMELTENERIASFHRGVLDFTNEFQRAINLTGYGFEDIRWFIHTLVERAVAYPEGEEVSQLMNLTHADDFGNESVMDFRHHRLKAWWHLLHLPRLFRRLRASRWRHGSVATLDVPGLNSLLRLLEIVVWRIR